MKILRNILINRFLKWLYKCIVTNNSTIHKSFCQKKKCSGSGGIRTHASEETGALNQRLRPLGHATLLIHDGSFGESIFWNLTPFSSQEFSFNFQKFLSEVGFEPTPSYEDQKSLYYSLSREQGLYLESGALDHSAILTALLVTRNRSAISNQKYDLIKYNLFYFIHNTFLETKKN